MQVKCVICDVIDKIDEDSLEAKRLRNQRITLYLCPTCDQRIGEKTKARHASGKFCLYQEKQNKNNFI